MLIIGAVLGTVFSLLGLLFPRPIARLLGAHPEILALTAEYLQVMVGFSIAFVVNNVMIAFVRNDGRPNLAMTAMLVGSLSNVVLDYILVFPAQLGMFGAALATGISPVISLCILSCHWFKRKNHFHFNVVLDYILVFPAQLGMFGAALATGISPVISLCILSCHWFKRKNHFHFKQPRFCGRELRHIIGSGIPSFILELSNGIVILVFNMVLLSISGDTAVAAYGVIANVALVCISIFTGIGQGIQPVVSRCYGAGERMSVQKALRWGTGLALCSGCILMMVGLLFPEPIIAAFNRENDPVLAEMARSGLRIYFVSFLFAGSSIVLTAYFAACAKPLPSLVLSLLRGIVAVVPLALILPRIFGLTGVWATVPTAEALTLAVGAVFYLVGRRDDPMTLSGGK